MARALAYRTPKEAPDTRIFPDRMWQQMFASDTMPGAGSQYLGGLTDSDGDYLDGGKAYHVHMPADVPAENYWSYVLYDAETRSLLDNGQPFPSIASNTNLKLNADSSADLYFGPEAPKNGSTNWIKTVPGRGYVGGLRLYSPTKAFFEKHMEAGQHREGEVTTPPVAHHRCPLVGEDPRQRGAGPNPGEQRSFPPKLGRPAVRQPPLNVIGAGRTAIDGADPRAPRTHCRAMRARIPHHR